MINVQPEAPPGATQDLVQALQALRPKLHRYCARMTGSVIDGEDAVQETLLKALRSPPVAEHLEPWVFGIARNASLDLLRRRARSERTTELEDSDDPVTPDDQLARKQALAATVQTFLRLPPAQRSAVILMDVLDYSLRDIETITGSTIPAIKSSLHRGRARLRELSNQAEPSTKPGLNPAERSLFEAYLAHFNARDFDAVRDLLADEVRLDLVARTHLSGKTEVSTYFSNYAATVDWHFTLGSVDGRPALLSRDPRRRTAETTYFVLLDWRDGRLAQIRDFRYARYALEGATLSAE